MGAVLAAFLVWLFATGKFQDWLDLAVKPANKSEPQIDNSGTDTTATKDKSSSSSTSGSSDIWKAVGGYLKSSDSSSSDSGSSSSSSSSDSSSSSSDSGADSGTWI